MAKILTRRTLDMLLSNIDAPERAAIMEHDEALRAAITEWQHCAAKWRDLAMIESNKEKDENI